MMLRRSSTSSVEPTPEWSELRVLARNLLGNQKFDLGLSAVILSNLALVILETDAAVDEGRVPVWITRANYFLLTVYTVELVLRLYVYRGAFIYSAWNLMDFSLVTCDLVLLILGFVIGDLPSVSVLRVLRLARLARSYKVLVMFPELFLMMRGLAGALRSVFWGMCLILFAVAIFAILAVNLLHDINREVFEKGGYGDCERCARAFESVFHASLTFVQQVVAGDSWGEVTVPIIEHAPWTGLFFGLVFVTKSLLIMNLILGMIVDAAAEARKGSDSELARAREKERIEARHRLLGLCRELDVDCSGRLTMEKLMQGYVCNPDFADVLQSMDIQKEDMETVYEILDEDKNGHVNYEEFADQIHKMKTSDSHTMLVFIKHYVLEIRAKLSQQLKAVESDIYDTINRATITQQSNMDDCSQRRWVGSPTSRNGGAGLGFCLEEPEPLAGPPDNPPPALALTHERFDAAAKIAGGTADVSSAGAGAGGAGRAAELTALAMQQVKEDLVRGMKELMEANNLASQRVQESLNRLSDRVGAGRERERCGYRAFSADGAGANILPARGDPWDPFGQVRRSTTWCSTPGRGDNNRERVDPEGARNGH
eukprot:TRINITY_DN72072_c0_g1_i1.p1 TRINITY_DN72072_c0_g1~~TRINITY_DN72072_c0_g1_i1.p1  ORF type:complete len:599 (+),score=143.13 TRINITY_DN72072_c0_g1_i1:209-2005(+)